MDFHFDGEVAMDVGIKAAVIYYGIERWVLKNKANNKNYHDGHYWTYNSVAAFKELFPFFSEKEIRSALKKLEDEGYIVSGHYNKSAYDRTKWYALGDKGTAHLGDQKENFDLSKRANENAQKGEPIPSILTNRLDSVCDTRAREEEPEDPEYEEVKTAFMLDIGQLLEGPTLEDFKWAYEHHGKDRMRRAIREAKRHGGRSLAYVLRILDSWEQNGEPQQRRSNHGSTSESTGGVQTPSKYAIYDQPNGPYPWDLQPDAGGTGGEPFKDCAD